MKNANAWRGSIRVLVAAMALAGATLAQSAMVWAQEQKAETPAPAVRAFVRLVLVDALVTDKDGKMVTGLGAPDFTVLEDGKPQKVTTVSFEQAAEVARALRSQRASLPPNVTTNRPAYRVPAGPMVIVVLDALNTRSQDQSRARMELLKYLDTQLQPGQQVAVYTLSTSLRILQDFTDDPALLKAAIQGFRPNESMAMQVADINARVGRRSGARPESLHGGGVDLELERALSRMQLFYEEQANVVTDARVGTTLTAFRYIAQAVAGLPGRKNLVWVTGSFPLATYSRIIQYSENAVNDPNAVRIEHDYEDMIRETASLLNDAQVAVYPVDARGLIGQLLGGAEDQGLNAGGQLKAGAEYAQDVQLASRSLQETQATMQQVAADTGGKVFTNRNDLDNSVALSAQDGASYYLLGYTPEGKADGKFHKIAVKVNRPGVTVRARHGYYAYPFGEEAKASKQHEAEVGMAMRASSPVATGVTFDARVVPPAPAAKMKVGADFLVDPTTLTVEDAGGGSKRLALEFHAVAYQEDGKVAGQRDVATKATLKAANFAAIQQQGLAYHVDLELPPGRYMLRLGVVDSRSGFIGTADLPLLLEGPK
ncbi:MAG: VWA domain-containing protein [Acidobacteriia bacterium]|nr:VWA domain-containing protein [Terriglobia bacterium]